MASAGPRSFDDVDIALSNRNSERVLMHQHSASNLAASGGTLPRLGKNRVGHGGGVVVIRTPVRPNSNSDEFGAWVVLRYSSYEVFV